MVDGAGGFSRIIESGTGGFSLDEIGESILSNEDLRAALDGLKIDGFEAAAHRRAEAALEDLAERELDVVVTDKQGDPIQVSLVQGNAPQITKWDPDQIQARLDLYADLTRQHWDSDLVIWPETAVPSLAHRVEEEFLSPLAAEAEARGSEILLGIPVYDEASGRYYNAMQTVGPVRASYYKRHLVPFGEYFPVPPNVREWMAMLSLPHKDLSAGDDEQPRR